MPRNSENLSLTLDKSARIQTKDISAEFPPANYLQVLDVGSGLGRLSQALHAQGYQVTGLDKHDGYSQAANSNKYGPNYIVGDFQSIIGQKFDFIISIYNSFGQYSTSQDAYAIIADLSALLNPGGALLIQCGSMEWAKQAFTRQKPVTMHKGGDLLTTKSFNWEKRELRLHYNLNGISYSTKSLMFEKKEIVDALEFQGFKNIQIRDNLNDSKCPSREHFYALANKPGTY